MLMEVFGHSAEDVAPAFFSAPRWLFLRYPSVEKLLWRVAAIRPLEFRKALGVLISAVIALCQALRFFQYGHKIVVKPVEQALASFSVECEALHIQKLRRFAYVRQNGIDFLPQLRVFSPEFVRVALFPLGMSHRVAQRIMHLLANRLPFLKISRGVSRDKPVIPLARKRAGLLPRKSNPLACEFSTDSGDLAGDVSVPLPKLLLSRLRPNTGTGEKLSLVTRLISPAVFLPHIVGKPLASDVIAVVVLT